jgi:catechol 2,3-dioxygenase-like lactoylglutathione lyase family enzyme
MHPMRRHIRGIDHVVILTRDLERARDTYGRLGFTLTPRGYHTLGSRNHCIMFGRDYLELLAVPRPHPAQLYYTEFLARGEGLAALALATDDANAAHAELAAAGIAADPPLDFSRPVEGLADASFRIVQLPVAQTPGCRTFLCQHFTRGVVWRPEWQWHANGASEIAALAVIADEPHAAAASYARVFDARPGPVEDGLLVPTGSAPIALGSRWKIGHRLDGVGLPLRARPLVAALFIRVADRRRAAEAIRKGGFAPVALKDGSFAVSADDACGVALVFG